MKDNQLGINEPCNILFLLPYSEKAELINKQQKIHCLKFLKSIVNFSIEALCAFSDGALVKFDAQVGENLCQIRAYKNVLLAKKWLLKDFNRTAFKNIIDKFKSYQLKINLAVLEWNTLFEKSFHYVKKLDGQENLQTFLERLDLQFEIEEDIFYLITCYLLKYFAICEDKVISAIDYNMVAVELMISKYLSRKLIKKYQEIVSIIGCKFITNLSREIRFNNEYYLIIQNLYRISDENRQVFPCLIVTEIILFHCIQEQVPILVIAKKNKRECIYFLLSGDKNNKLKLLRSQEYLSIPFCFVILGNSTASMRSVEFINQFLNFNPIKIILANTSAHPQYSGKKLEHLKDNPFEEMDIKAYSIENQIVKLTELKKYAENNGCTKENQSMFFIRHIYASVFSYEINRLYSNLDVKPLNAFEVIKNEQIFQEII